MIDEALKPGKGQYDEMVDLSPSRKIDLIRRLELRTDKDGSITTVEVSKHIVNQTSLPYDIPLTVKKNVLLEVWSAMVKTAHTTPISTPSYAETTDEALIKSYKRNFIGR
jgi:hypothetical protein